MEHFEFGLLTRIHRILQSSDRHPFHWNPLDAIQLEDQWILGIEFSDDFQSTLQTTVKQNNPAIEGLLFESKANDSESADSI